MNSNIKTKFLNTLRSALAKEETGQCFQFFGSAETAFSKDLFDFTEEEIDSLLKESSLPDEKQNKLRVITKRYKKWCESNGYRNTAPKPTKQNMVYSAKNLQQVMDNVFDAEELCTSNLLLRAYFWLAFIGIPKEVAHIIKKDAVKPEIGYVLYDRKAYLMPPESIFSLEKCKNLKEFFFIGPHRQEWRKRSDSELLISGYFGGFSRPSIVAEIGKHTRDKPYSLAYDSIRKSGLFIRVYKQERQEGQNKLYETIIKERWKSSDSINAFQQSIKKMESDYADWKQKFAFLIED